MISAVNHIFKHCAMIRRTMAQSFCFIPFVLFCALFLQGCSEEPAVENTPELHIFTGQVMGTWYTVKYLPSAASELSHEDINALIHTRLSRVDQLMSTYKPESEVSRFNRALPGEWFDVSAETFEVVSLSQSVSEKTAGAFDVSVARLVNLWGFGPDHQTAQVPDEEDLFAVLIEVGYEKIEFHDSELKLRKKTPLHIDLSAIAKGYGVDQVANFLDETNVTTYMVEVGGEIRTRGLKPNGKPWRIAIESPNTDQRDVHSIIDITDRAVATSGDYRNYFEKDGQRFSHTIDPKTGYPITHNLASVTVVGKTAAEVDALATAFSVLGLDQAMRYAKAYNVAAYFIVKEPEGFVGKGSDAFIDMTRKKL
jgi:FAD:protein FMN transferase